MNLKEFVEDLEKTLIEEALTEHRWNVTRAADSLGVLRTTLWMKMKKYGFNRPKAPYRPHRPPRS